MRDRYEPRSAFTLIEIAVTLVVLGILATVSAITFSAVSTNSTNELGPQALGVVQIGLRNVAAANNYVYPVDTIGRQPATGTPVMSVSGIAVQQDLPSLAPQSVRSLEDFNVAVTFPSTSPSSSTVVGLAIEPTIGHCYAIMDRTIVTGEQLATVSASWNTTEGNGCRIDPLCLEALAQMSTSRQEYKGVELDKPATCAAKL